MYEIDKIDKEIINLLVEDGRRSCAEIARCVGDISERSVRYRLERLVSEGVIKVSAIVNPKALGFSISADVLLEVESGMILEVAREMTRYECVSYVACDIGQMDISLQVVGRDTDEVYHFVTEVVGKTPGVRKTTTILVPLVLKDVYQWKIPDSYCIRR